MRPSLMLFAALLGGVTAAAAQSVAPFTDVITITATARPEPVTEVTATTDVVTAGEIEDRQAGQASELLRTVAGLELVQGGSPGKATSLFSRGTNSSHTLVLWNGIALNDPFLGGFDWSTLSTDGVERIEVVRGPYSALYGSHAVGGVVQLVTRRGGGGDHLGEARLEGGSNRYLRAGAAGGKRFGSTAIDLFGHLRRGEGEVENDGYDGAEIDLALDHELGRGVTVGALLRAAESEIGIPFDFAGRPSPRRRQQFETTSLAVPLTVELDGWHLALQASRTATDLELADPDDPFAASRAEAKREQARVGVRRGFGAEIEATFGGDWERQEVRSRDAFGPGLENEAQRTWAAFAQLSWNRGPLRLDAGLRRDDNDAFGAETSSKLGAAWALSGSWRLRASYGEAFRAPSLADLYYPGFSNPGLQPERSQSYELAVEGGRAAWRTTVALFQNELENLIEFDFATFVPQNLGRARTRGVEAALAYRRGTAEARLVATRLEAENLETGGRLLRRPDLTASLLLFWRPASWTLGASARYVGERVDFGDLALGSYATLDLSVARSFSGRFEPFLRVENLLDANYEEAAGFPAPGLGYRAGVSLRF